MNIYKITVNSATENFWAALKIYYEHPNSINKQVLYSEHVFAAKLKSTPPIDFRNIYNDICGCMNANFNLNSDLRNMKHLEFIEDEDFDNVFFKLSGLFLLIRKLIPKLNETHWGEFYEYLFIDKESTKVQIYSYHLERKKLLVNLDTSGSRRVDPYIILKYKIIKFTYNNNELEVFYKNSLGEKGINWLKCIFIPKFTKIMLNVKDGDRGNKISNQLCYTSKIDIVQYYKLYKEMKKKYAKFLIENWSENTDPKKFVYEDIGIATYLMMLWSGGNIPQKNTRKQRFVDLGCGNGLLVHILNSEGHLGVGLDMRKRKIWDSYTSTTVLKEETIIPTTHTIYPDADWLIGNHSDELTAWIPVMARRSNPNCQYFVLPCCPYQLNGTKYQRKNTALSSYQDFISYVKDISELCGFETYVDKLRIPSTKRICLIGFNEPELSEEKIKMINERMMICITQECQSFNGNTERNFRFNRTKIGEIDQESENLSLNFKVRKSVEKVRNCTKLSQTVIEKILKTVAVSLLQGKCVLLIVRNGAQCNWNRGRKLSICELAKSIDENLLKQLKKECKGLQTLLKNHHYIFEVGQGFVQFRSPESMLQISNKFYSNANNLRWKQRRCWFYNNHPDKCPLTDDKCSYSHDI